MTESDHTVWKALRKSYGAQVKARGYASPRIRVLVNSDGRLVHRPFAGLRALLPHEKLYQYTVERKPRKVRP